MSHLYKWKATFNLEGLKIKEGKWHNKEFLLENDSSKEYLINGMMEFDSSTYTNYHSTIKYIEQRIINLVSLDALNVALLGYTKSPILENLDINLVNYEELDKEGIHPPTKLSLESSITITTTHDVLNHIYNILPNIQKLPDYNDSDRILTLFGQGASIQNEYGRFINLWRSFNAFYNYCITGTISERKKIEKTFKKYYKKDLKSCREN